MNSSGLLYSRLVCELFNILCGAQKIIKSIVSGCILQKAFFKHATGKKFFIQRVASEIAKENAGNEGGIMKITYINHSGFLIETRDCYYIFDYYKGELPYLDKEKEVIVFCSHFHKDHFNPQIFGILEDMGMTYQAVLANDIRKRNHLSDLKITYVYHDQTYNLDNGTEVDTLLSNDSGVAFIVKTKEGTIYHAGDLNDWYWMVS